MPFPFENLEVWKVSIQLGSEILKICDHLPRNIQFSLTDQLRRASTSISLNIAEGAGRHSNKEFVRFLLVSRGSLYELVTNLRLCHLAGYLGDKEHEALYAESNRICQMLNGLIRSLRE